MSVNISGTDASSTAPETMPLTRRDLRDALYAKAGVGALAAALGVWFVFQSATSSAGMAALLVSALCLMESAATWFRVLRR